MTKKLLLQMIFVGLMHPDYCETLSEEEIEETLVLNLAANHGRGVPTPLLASWN